MHTDDDHLKRAAAELIASLGSRAPTGTELRRRLRHRHRGRATAVLGLLGLAVVLAATALIRGGPHSIATSAPGGPDASVAVPLEDPGVSEPEGCGRMPDVVGMGVAQALASLGAATSSPWSVLERQVTDGRVGLVIEQSPPPGASLCNPVSPWIVFGAAPYIVAAGDTYASIAQTHGVSIQALLEINGRTEESPLNVGEPLVIPNTATDSDPASFATIPTTVHDQ